MVLPGKPPLWTPLEPYQLQEDKGIYYRDRNAACYPDHPLEPAVVSVMKMQNMPRRVDVFACGSTLGNLLRFVRGDGKPFRMLVEAVGKTVHLIRRENSPREKIPDVRGYGHTFPEAYTTWEPDVRRSLSHQRIVKYKFGGLDVMVRFEGDGYIKPNEPSTPRARVGFGNVDLFTQFEGLSAGQASAADDSEKFINALEVRDAGSKTPQETIFDLKTRSIKRRDEDTLGEQLSRLWVSQTPNLILAYHERGIFRDVQIKNVTEEVQVWEEQNQSSLGRFFSLLRHIVDTALSYRNEGLEIVRLTGGNLEIRKQASDAGDMLSDAVRQKWADWLEDGVKRERRATAGTSYASPSGEVSVKLDKSEKGDYTS